MPIVPSRAGRIRALVERLASERSAERDSAVAQLTLIGPRVLEPLRASLPDASEQTRLAALEVLERLDDPRVLPLLLPLTEDPSRAVAARAVELTARRPDSRSVAALARALGPGPAARRRAAVDALAGLHAAGVVEALAPLVDTLVDDDMEPRLRIAVLDAFLEMKPPLPLSTLRPLGRRLASSADPKVAARAAELAPPPRTRKPGRAPSDTLGRLRIGEVVEDATLEQRIEALESAEHPPAIETLVRTLGTGGGPASIPVLSRALGRLAEPPGPADDPEARIAARAAIHTALAALDSRVALHDLRELVAARPTAAMPALLAAAARVGDASLVPALARAGSEDPGLMPQCAAVYASIAQRERLRRTSPSLRRVRAEHRPALEAFLKAARRRR